MDLQILQDKLNELANELEEIRKQLEEAEKKESGRWKPQVGEKYWSIDSGGSPSEADWDGCRIDKNRYAIGNRFKTREEAEFITERLKVFEEMKEFEESPEYEWDCKNHHYYLKYNGIYNETNIDYTIDFRRNDIYFETKEKAQECIDKVGADRIKKYYLRIKEE